MGFAPWVSEPRNSSRDELGRYRRDDGPPRVVREYVASSDYLSRRKHPAPRSGDRFGELTVSGFLVAGRGGLKGVLVRCSCGAEEHVVDPHNLYLGKSTRCDVCAKLASRKWTKHYWGYADICPDDAHRTRLLNRIAAIFSRCQNPRSRNFHHYGGRGIKVSPEFEDRREFLRHVLSLPGWDQPELELDRRDNERGYEQGNLRFVTRSKNMFNRRSVGSMQKEMSDLRSRLRRAEEQIHSCDRCRAAYRP